MPGFYLRKFIRWFTPASRIVRTPQNDFLAIFPIQWLTEKASISF
jgi:hypothetical protein